MFPSDMLCLLALIGVIIISLVLIGNEALVVGACAASVSA